MPDLEIESRRWNPPYIVDQEWRLLLDTDNPQKYLQPVHFRGDRVGRDVEVSAEQWHREWADLGVVERSKVALNIYSDRESGKVPLQYLVLTTDAGIGKSKSTEWLHYRLSCDDSSTVSFHFELSQLLERNKFEESHFSEQLLDHLAGIWRHESGDRLSEREAVGYIAHARDTGKLCLILDGLDQLAGDPSLIVWMMRSPLWNKTRIIVAGRPNAINARWEHLFQDRPWRFIHVESFDESQQDRFLGPVLKEIPEHVVARLRPIMHTPRVLEYLLLIEDYSGIRTAADIYYRAIENMIKYGILHSVEAHQSIAPVPRSEQRKVDPTQIRTSFALLSALAFESLILRHVDPTLRSGKPSRPEDKLEGRYNYLEHVDAGSDYDEFLSEHLRPRWSSLKQPGNLDDNLRGLGALNYVLENGLFDTDMVGLNQIKFSNRSLHEFLVAYFLANYAEPKDVERLWDWIYIKDNAETDAYYFVWLFLCEMPRKQCRPESWLRSIAILFQPNQCDDSIEDTDKPILGEQTRYYAKRSTEMIFRCWEVFQTFRNDATNPKIQAIANRIFLDWISEFEKSIVSAEQGKRRRRSALEVQDHFMEIEGGVFRMGTLPEKQGVAAMSAESRRPWQDWFNDWRDNLSSLDEWVNGISFPLGRSGKESRRRHRDHLAGFVDRNDFQGLLEDRFPADQTPIQVEEIRIATFSLGRTTITNRWFRLFDPGHNQRSSDLWKDNNVSPTPDHPAVFLSWYDSFVFAQWLHWNGASCRLPWEDEWEYAAKLGLELNTQWHFRYWWGDEFDAEIHGEQIQCYETQKSYSTVVAYARQSSPESRRRDKAKLFGLAGMLGNVWEWCQDRYRAAYDRSDDDQPGNATASRVVRGGSFNYSVEDCSCSTRGYNFPANANNYYGVRVARVQ